jgi:UDP-N-acetyl-D-glucosamine dehydrogenase
VPRLPAFGLASVPLEEAITGVDAVVIVTAHPGLDVELLARTAPLVVDFRGVTRGLAGRLVAL